MNRMDEITNRVTEMYKQFPYPSPSSDDRKTNELLNLLRIFTLESKFGLDGKKFLDAGTGTGHRLVPVATHYKNSKFTAIDNSNESIKIAKELAKKSGANNINFEIVDLMKKLPFKDNFDIILCMGVLHHLSVPSKGLENLCSVLSENGILFLYLYGRLGGAQRMTQKRIISLLMGGESGNFRKGIELVRDLGFNNFEYGWNIERASKEEEDSLIVDAFLHVHEKLYDTNEINSLFQSSGLYGFSIFGITADKNGLLFDTRLHDNNKLTIPYTDLSKILKSSLAKESYDNLSVKERSELIELFYQPNGYTVVGLTKKAYESLSEDSRIKSNFILCKTI